MGWHSLLLEIAGGFFFRGIDCSVLIFADIFYALGNNSHAKIFANSTFKVPLLYDCAKIQSLLLFWCAKKKEKTVKWVKFQMQKLLLAISFSFNEKKDRFVAMWK